MKAIKTILFAAFFFNAGVVAQNIHERRQARQREQKIRNLMSTIGFMEEVPPEWLDDIINKIKDNGGDVFIQNG